MNRLDSRVARGATRIFAILMILSAVHISQAASPSVNLTSGFNQSGAFLDSRTVTLIYTANYICNPQLSSNANLTCGIKTAGVLLGTLPVWEIAPYFAGISALGGNNSGATSQGYAVYNGNVFATQCGSGLSPSACPQTPVFIKEVPPLLGRLINNYSGTNKLNRYLPGVVPMPAHDNLLLHDYGNTSIPWYVIIVRVYDPNVFPNPVTGTCTQVAPSNLTNATGNCLTSFDALVRAFGTHNRYVPLINKVNPLYNVTTNLSTQVVISLVPTIAGVSGILYPNTNIFETFRVSSPAVTAQKQSNSTAVIIIGIGIIAVLVANLVWFHFGRGQVGPRRERKRR